MKIYIDNAILSSVADEIEANGIIMTCNADMEIEISEDDYNKLCNIIDVNDIKTID